MTDDTPDLDRIVADLRRRREQLTTQLAQLTAPPDEQAVVSFGKRIGDGTTEAVERVSTTLTARSLTATLADVERALERVEEGTWGRCEICGDPIPAERLEARPATSRCVAHADQAAPGR